MIGADHEPCSWAKRPHKSPTMGKKGSKKQQDVVPRKKSVLWCFRGPPVLHDEPLMSVEQFRLMHRRRQKGKQVSSRGPLYTLV